MPKSRGLKQTAATTERAMAPALVPSVTPPQLVSKAKQKTVYKQISPNALETRYTALRSGLCQFVNVPGVSTHEKDAGAEAGATVDLMKDGSRM